jgi:superfamily I DNA/RNA helicase
MVLSQREKHSQAAMLEDECDALQVLIDRCLETGKHKLFDLEALCESLFVDEGNKLHCILLCSVHKAKGLEWPRVYILGRFDYMPFWKAEMDWERVQEQNLIYVAVTRAEHELVFVTGVASALDKAKSIKNSFSFSDK